jgi:hypothetical protein
MPRLMAFTQREEVASRTFTRVVGLAGRAAGVRVYRRVESKWPERAPRTQTRQRQFEKRAASGVMTTRCRRSA